MYASKPLKLQDLYELPKAWCVWRKRPKPGSKLFDKVPYGLDGRTFKGGSTQHGVETAGTFDEAEAALDYHEGVGLLLGGPVEALDGRYLVLLDLDEVLANDELACDAVEPLLALKTYGEVSPSGTGVKLYFTATADELARAKALPKKLTLPNVRDDQERPTQVDFMSKGFGTWTEEALDDCDELLPLSSVLDQLEALHAAHGRAGSVQGAGRVKADPASDDPGEPPDWFIELYRSTLQETPPAGVQRLIEHDPVFKAFWYDGVKPDSGGDMSGSGVDFSLAHYLAGVVPVEDILSALLHCPAGQLSTRLRNGEDPDGSIRRRVWRCIQPAMSTRITADADLAVKFEAWAAGRWCYVGDLKTWRKLEGRVWVDQPEGAVQAMRAFLDAYRRDRKPFWADAKGVAALRTLKAASKVKSVETLVRGGPLLRMMADFDPMDGTLNTPEGAVDGRTLLPVDDAGRLYTKTTKTSPAKRIDPQGWWAKFLADTFKGRTDDRDYLQKMCGYGLLGTAAEHKALLLIGPTRSGKSTFLQVLEGVLGSYAGGVSPDVFKEGGHPTYTVSMNGLRFGIGPELGNVPWDGEKIKAMVSSDTVLAKPLYARWTVSFKPTFLLMFPGNHMPPLRGADPALAERIRVVMFRNTKKKEERLLELADRIIAREADQVMLWLMQGLQAYLQDIEKYGVLQEPESVLAGSSEYVRGEDALGMMLECEFEPDAAESVALQTIYPLLKDYLRKLGKKDTGNAGLTKELRARGYHLDHDGNYNYRVWGIKRKTIADTVH